MKNSRMTESCNDCGKPRDSRGKLGLCKVCSGRRMGKIYGRLNFPGAQKNKWYLKDTPLHCLPPNIAGYIAGVIDADGTVGDAYVSIASKHKEYLELISSLIGGKVSPACKTYQLALRKIEKQYILPQIIPHMILKREKAISCLNYELGTL